jgi:hypothetical protein
MPGPSPRYAAFEMPLSLRRRQRTTMDPGHSARGAQVTDPETQPQSPPEGGDTEPPVVTPTPEIETSETLRVSDEAAESPARSHEPATTHRVALADSPSTVMVLGDSSPEGVALVLALTRSGHQVVAVEHDRTAAGLRLAQLGVVIPAQGSVKFEKALLSVARQSGATAVLAVHPEAMHAVAGAAAALEETGTAFWSPDPELFRLCKDRSAFYDVLASSGLPVEKTGLGPIENGPVRGRQFSVDVLADRAYEVVAAVSSWRVAADGDVTTVAETFTDARLLDLLRAVCAALRVEGPAVVQGYVSITGRAWLTSLQPGFSPLLPLTGAAGVDVVDLALAGTLGLELPGHVLTHRPGVRMLQYLDQVFEG